MSQDRPAVFPLRKFYSEQMFVLMRVQLLNHADTQPVERLKCKRAMRYLYEIKSGMLEVREDEFLIEWMTK